jgi:hypothetical protein
MSKTFKMIRDNLVTFWANNAEVQDIDRKMITFLVNEIIVDLKEKKINNFHEWLIYYSTNGNDFVDIITNVEKYYSLVSEKKYDEISLDMKVIMYNAVGLYCVEMGYDDVPEGELLSMIIQYFIQIVDKYELYRAGNLKIKGEISISNNKSYQFLTPLDETPVPITV